MKGKSTLSLVIDASVARAAGETGHPVSSACREYMLAVREMCHKVVLTRQIMEEWENNQSRFTRKWRRSMAAKKKRLSLIDPVASGLDLDKYESSQRKIVEKDLLLIEAALAADNVIVSCDETFYEALGSTKSGRTLRRRLIWHNPVKGGLEQIRSIRMAGKSSS